MNTLLKTIGEVTREASATLKLSGITNPTREARLVIQYVTGRSYSSVAAFSETTLSYEEWNKVYTLIERRSLDEPLAYLIGEKEFWGLTFKVSRDTLIPRPESETIVVSILGRISSFNKCLRLLVLGTGSGCLLGALLSELPNSCGVGVDNNAETARVADSNMKLLGFGDRVEIKTGNWGQGLRGDFDLIVCNPPYVPSNDVSNLENTVKYYEPHGALDGGMDGLDAYRVVCPQIFHFLRSDGFAAVEIGHNQTKQVSKIFLDCGMSITGIRRDLSQIHRCLLATVQN